MFKSILTCLEIKRKSLLLRDSVLTMDIIAIQEKSANCDTTNHERELLSMAWTKALNERTKTREDYYKVEGKIEKLKKFTNLEKVSR